jgi:hypothetical protein
MPCKGNPCEICLIPRDDVLSGSCEGAPIAYTLREGGRWYMPPVPDDWFAVLFESSRIFDRGLKKLGFSGWRVK